MTEWLTQEAEEKERKREPWLRFELILVGVLCTALVIELLWRAI